MPLYLEKICNLIRKISGIDFSFAQISATSEVSSILSSLALGDDLTIIYHPLQKLHCFKHLKNNLISKSNVCCLESPQLCIEVN
jgi:hypothetical protein